MIYYQNMINNTVEKIVQNSQYYKNSIIVGDNSSGKSEILKHIIERKMQDGIYFIDATNRTFDVDCVELESEDWKRVKLDKQCVVMYRIQPNNFNLQDTFYVTSSIEKLYAKYEQQISKLCKALLNIKFEIKAVKYQEGDMEKKAVLDGKIMTLSSGYQAILRIFIELLYFQDVVTENKIINPMIVIDEIDEYLSPKYSAKIFNFLAEEFSEFSFVVSTHSCDLVKHSKDFNLIVLDGKASDYYDSRDLEERVDIETIFTRLFFENEMEFKSENDEVDELLRKFLNRKLMKLWDEETQKQYDELKEEELAPHQRYLWKQIKEW